MAFLVGKKSIRVASITGLLLFIIFMVTSSDSSMISSAGSLLNNGGLMRGNVPLHKNNEFKQPVLGGSEPASFDPAEEYAAVLEAAPIVLFSKSFCPYCKKLKKLLKENYTFEPRFHTVELDQHAYANDFAAYVSSTTGHTTVPNFVVNGKSVGGYDDLEKLHKDGQLIKFIEKASNFQVVVKPYGTEVKED